MFALFQGLSSGLTDSPADLQEAFSAHDAGKLDKAGLVAVQDRAAKQSIELMERAGQEVVTDGEQRASSCVFPLCLLIQVLSSAEACCAASRRTL